MAIRNSADYIQTAAESVKHIEEVKEYMRTHEDTRMEYEISYSITINGKKMTERVLASSQKEAIEIVKRNCGMVGWIPYGITAVEITKV